AAARRPRRRCGTTRSRRGRGRAPRRPSRGRRDLHGLVLAGDAVQPLARVVGDDVGVEHLRIAGEGDGGGGRLVVGLDPVHLAGRDVGAPQRRALVVDGAVVLHGVSHGRIVAHFGLHVHPSQFRLKSRARSADGRPTPRPTAPQEARSAGAIVLTVHSQTGASRRRYLFDGPARAIDPISLTTGRKGARACLRGLPNVPARWWCWRRMKPAPSNTTTSAPSTSCSACCARRKALPPASSTPATSLSRRCARRSPGSSVRVTRSPPA